MGHGTPRIEGILNIRGLNLLFMTRWKDNKDKTKNRNKDRNEKMNLNNDFLVT